jgi:hypothetical protein
MSLDESVAAEAPRPSAIPLAGWAQIGTSEVSKIAYGATVSLNGRLWGLEGDQTRTVIYSDDAVTWQAPQTNLPYRMGCAACAHNGALYVSGGAYSEETNEIFFSTDGISWARTQAPWPPRYGHCMISFQGRLLVFGGRTQQGQFFEDFWASTDGRNWSAAGTAPGRINGAAAVVGNRVCALGGPQRTIAWYDGARWISEMPPWSTRLFPGAAVIASTLYMTGGFWGQTHFKETWSWAQGVGWTRLEDAPFTNLEAPCCGPLFGAVIVFGGSMGGGPARPEIYAYAPGQGA